MKKGNYFFRKNKKNDYNICLKNNETDIVTRKSANISNNFFCKYSTIIFSVMLVVVFVLVLGGSYAFFTTTVKAKDFVIYTGNLAVNYSKKTDVINVENLYPMTNTEGLEQTAHKFTITNDGNISARYQVRLELDNSIKDMIPINYIKISYSTNDSSYSEPILLSDLDTSLAFIRNVQLVPTISNTIGVKLWVDLNAPNEIQGKTFKAKIVVDSIQNVDDGYVVDTVPIIYLNKDNSGNQDINLKKNDTYLELGVAKIEDDQEILAPSSVTKTYEYYDGEDLTFVTGVDTSKIGIYYITYSITDKSNNVGKATRIVTVNNTDTIPSITLKGDATIALEETDEYVEQGVTVDNNNRVVVISDVKTNTIGTYILRYIVIDEKGNLNSVIRTVNINKATTLSNKIFAHNNLIDASPTLTDSSNNTTDESGLYKSTATNSGDPTYYFRGNVENNYVSFAGFTWRIVRINEDGTIRIVMQDGINNTDYKFNSNSNNKDYMYYSNSDTAKPTLETWYQTNIVAGGYSDKVATGNYYCEQAKVVYDNSFATPSGANMAVYKSYTPNFNCSTDANGKGLVNASIGLLTYDEVVYAGGYNNKSNRNYYLYNNTDFWTMSPAGFTGSSAIDWYIFSTGSINYYPVSNSLRLRPVINLKADTTVTGLGTSIKPYKVIY